MSKNCPKCGKEVPEDAKFCMDCGHTIAESQNQRILNNIPLSAVFMILIVAILVIGGIFILTSTIENNNYSDGSNETSHQIDLTITDIDGWDSNSGKKSYTLYTNAIFNSVPGDLKGYNIKTTYYDSNNTEIGHETEKLQNIYLDSDYELGFGYYTTYKLPNPDYVTVEIIKDGKVIDSYTEKIDKNRIDYLN